MGKSLELILLAFTEIRALSFFRRWLLGYDGNKYYYHEQQNCHAELVKSNN